MAEINVSGIMDSLFNGAESLSTNVENTSFLATKPFESFGIAMTYGDIIAVVVIIAATFIIAKLLSNIVRRMFSGKIDKGNLAFMEKLTRWTIYFFGFLAVSTPLGIDFSGLMVAGGIIAVAIGFASQSTLSNFISGLLLMFERPVSLGDNIAVKGTEGYVEDIGLMSTTLRTYKGVYVRVPNEAMFTSDITNYVAHIARRFDYNITIRYKDDAEKAMKIIKDTVDKHPYALKSPAPSVFVDNLGPNGSNLLVRIWAPSGYWWDAKTELLGKIVQALRAAGIVIPFDQNVVWFGHDQNKSLDRAMYGRPMQPSSSPEYLQTAGPGREQSAPENVAQVK
ncbi:mechanosensitive ion channel family protein [Methanorbis furvi]|uniref:Mechanosensitive ion channel protein MscS n=1 Tax=Methanorbis furvi TaxID=3028299 RepID=A0AAE4MBP7_9EURY|nr:hypothetical protein [Methanocorpusculaceae archaeon Ag1]